MKAILPLTTLVLTLLTACGHNELPGPAGELQPQTTAAAGRLVFGQYYGFCPPTADCAQVYKLEGNKLYADETNRVLGSESAIAFKASPLPAEKYDLARSLADDVPAELLTATQTVFGSPDAHDQGGIVLEITQGGNTRRFYLDNNEAALPATLVPYAQQIKRVVAALK